MNRDVVLQIIRTRQPLSRTDISDLAGLQKSTIGKIIEELVHEGLVVEEKVARASRGRYPVMISIGKKRGIPVIDIQHHEAIAAIVDVGGSVLAFEHISLPRQVDRAIGELEASILAMKRRHGIEFVASCAVMIESSETFGGIASQRQPLMQEEALRAWERLFGNGIEFVSPSEASLLGQMWAGKLDGVRDAVLVSISENVSCSVLSNGHVATGRKRRAGNFGHVCIDPNGPRCRCGRNGCWEMFVSMSAVLGYYVGPQSDARPVTPRGLIELALTGDAAAQAALSRYAEYVAEGLIIAVQAIAPEVVLLFGDVQSLWTQIEATVVSRLNSVLKDRPPIRLVPAHDPSRLLGAAMAVLQRCLPEDVAIPTRLQPGTSKIGAFADKSPYEGFARRVDMNGKCAQVVA